MFPLGLLQLHESISHGYFEARSLAYLQGGRNALLEWLRLPGDAVFIVGGVLPLIYPSLAQFASHGAADFREKSRGRAVHRHQRNGKASAMIGPVHIEVALAAGYAAFLMVVATGLEYGSSVTRIGVQDNSARLASNITTTWTSGNVPAAITCIRTIATQCARSCGTRAPAHTCNACARKTDCTDSEHGREIIHSSESWIETEAGKFHRVLSLTLLFLAALILIAEMFRHPTLPEVLSPGSVLALVLTRGRSLTRELLAGQNRNGSEPVRVVFGSRRL